MDVTGPETVSIHGHAELTYCAVGIRLRSARIVDGVVSLRCSTWSDANENGDGSTGAEVLGNL